MSNGDSIECTALKLIRLHRSDTAFLSRQPMHPDAVGAGLATTAAGNIAIDIGKKINRTTAAKALHC